MVTAVAPRDALADDSSDSDAQQSSPLFSAHSTTSSGAGTDLNDDYSDDDGDAPDDRASVPGSLGGLGSPAPSVYSLTESLIRASFRKEFGRDVQNHSEIYHFPADSPEFERLNNQHKMLTMVLGKYPPPLIDVLHDDPQGPQKAVLDLGCGTGAWLADVATDFPHVDAVGVDLVPPQITSPPNNVRTEVDDINLGLEHFYGQFNVVSARLISAGIKDYAGLVDQISRILRTEGLVVLGECDFRCYDEKMEIFPLPTSPAFCLPSIPAVARFIGHLRQCIRARGGHVDASSLLHRWISQHRAFQDIVHRDVYFPLCPFMKGDSAEAGRQRKIGLYVREDVLAFIDSGRPLLLKSGVPQEEVDGLIIRARRELAECATPCFMRLQCVYARKR